MDENGEITAEEKLRKLNEERKILKKQVLGEREMRLKKAAETRISRDKKLDEIRSKLNKISEEIYSYNKLGKVARNEMNILGLILEEIELKEI